MREW
ncbi:hypothetical protein CGLO_12897 [Colletotrichum gloeosporioides Cg-14]